MVFHRAVVLTASVLLVAFFTVTAAKDADDRPFGRMTEKNRDRFLKLAKSQGVDVEAEMEKAYHGDKGALSKIFGLAAQFDKLDEVARVYGNLIFASFLNLVEDRGEEFFVGAMTVHALPVQQKVRDMVYYSVIRVPRRHRDEVEREVRRDYRLMFPAEYVFGQNDPLFQ